MEFKGSLPGTEPSQTDWERVKREYESGALIPYDPNDPDDGPYDPNDDAAVEAYWKQATIYYGYPDPVLIQKDGVLCHPDGTPRESSRIEPPVVESTTPDVNEPAAKAS